MGRSRRRFFHLRDEDFLPIGEITQQGKSAHGAFTTSVHTAVEALFNRPAADADVLYVIPRAKTLDSAGVEAIHAPLPGRDLHLRIISVDGHDLEENFKRGTRNELAKILNTVAKKYRR